MRRVGFIRMRMIGGRVFGAKAEVKSFIRIWWLPSGESFTPLDFFILPLLLPSLLLS